ncbi:HRDC domain-containing protein [Flavobacteriaceae bacterium]|jgi:ribonuclease D|nr:HRDC domain-containing protein [Flavobacteriaceae bacterium]
MKIKVFNIRLAKEHLESDQKIVNEFLEKVEIKKSSTSLVEGKVNYWSIIIHYLEKSESESNSELETENKSEKKKPKLTESDLIKDELIIVDCLKQWRTEKAQEERLPAYMILSNLDIYSVVKEKPTNLSELLNVYGFGEKKVEKYGDDIISVLNTF